jgi:hypothetical protein
MYMVYTMYIHGIYQKLGFQMSYREGRFKVGCSLVEPLWAAVSPGTIAIVERGIKYSFQ